jgi:hypothetical protein
MYSASALVEIGGGVCSEFATSDEILQESPSAQKNKQIAAKINLRERCGGDEPKICMFRKIALALGVRLSNTASKASVFFSYWRV